jgi:2-amino-4-hydroxy-6-hydroxymethyldihydropteridine diphosphokinase
MTVAYVGLGANIGVPRRQLQAAFEALKALPQTRFLRASALFRSAPLGYANQPDFLNAAAMLDTELTPEALLDQLQGIEKDQGRERSFANAPRTLDLDLLLYGNLVLQEPRLTLPHPRMHQRAFVLQPLLELDPGVTIPGRGRAADLLAACDDQNVERIT